MIAGISYSVFNSEEHLVPSLRAIRSSVSYVNVVVQLVSNQGHPAAETLGMALDAAEAASLVDEIIYFEPNFNDHPSYNEFKKRSIGLAHAKKAGVSHFMTMDADEYYLKDEFDRAKEFIIECGIVASSVSTYFHVKRPIWRSRLPDNTCCAFLTKLETNTELDYGSFYPELVDPTRRLRGSAEPFHTFDVHTISMRHMNLVRLYGIEDKLRNSTNASMVDFMKNVQNAYNNWRFDEIFRFPNKDPAEIIEVDDLFGIDHLFKDFD